MKHLVLGGVRSGKSAFAEAKISQSSAPIHYIATSEVWDEEMASRIEKHRARRPIEWGLIEEPIQLAASLNALNNGNNAVIIECLSLWLTNLICLANEDRMSVEKAALLKAIAEFQGDLVIVSSEVGLGVMPMNAMARRFCDEIGEMNQKVANLTDWVTFVAAGLPMQLKSPA